MKRLPALVFVILFAWLALPAAAHNATGEAKDTSIRLPGFLADDMEFDDIGFDASDTE